MEILKPPTYPDKNIALCLKCFCEFRYFDDEVEGWSEEIFGGCSLGLSVKCPGCGHMITLRSEFCQEPDWIDHVVGLFKKIFKRKKKENENYKICDEDERGSDL